MVLSQFCPIFYICKYRTCVYQIYFHNRRAFYRQT